MEDKNETQAIKLYRHYSVLLAEPDDMTPLERQRLRRIKAIPAEVRETVEAEIVRLRESVMEKEQRADALIDFLNGEREEDEDCESE